MLDKSGKYLCAARKVLIAAKRNYLLPMSCQFFGRFGRFGCYGANGAIENGQVSKSMLSMIFHSWPLAQFAIKHLQVFIQLIVIECY